MLNLKYSLFIIFIYMTGNAVNEAHMEIIWGSCVKVERTILYIQMLVMNWSKIWKKEIQHGIRLRLAMKVQWQGHSLWKKIVMEIAKIDIWNRKCLIKYSLIYLFCMISYHTIYNSSLHIWLLSYVILGAAWKIDMKSKYTEQVGMVCSFYF